MLVLKIITRRQRSRETTEYKGRNQFNSKTMDAEVA